MLGKRLPVPTFIRAVSNSSPFSLRCNALVMDVEWRRGASEKCVELPRCARETRTGKGGISKVRKHR